MKTVLLIEDDPEFLLTLRLLLKCQGYSVTSSADNAKVIKEKDSRFDFVLLETNLQEYEGILRIVRKKNPKTKIVFIASTSSREVMDKVLKQGASCMIKKPIDHEILHAILLALGEEATKQNF